MNHRALWIAFVGVALVGAPLTASALAEDRPAWIAHLSGANEAPTAVETDAHGVAWFQQVGTTIRYRINVVNIEDVLMAHIHMGPAGVAGSVVVWLYPSAPPPMLIEGRSVGVLVTGTFDASDFVGPLGGMPFSDLIAAMNAGGAYVNVHTSAYGGGEIRGQIYPGD
ncbi:MAG: CHRD domain-containing protein [Methanobacteriota archaeon]